MLFFFPIGTVDKPRRQPMMVIAIVFLTLVLQALVHLGDAPPRQVFDLWGFVPDQSAPATFLTSIFLHESTWRMAMNLWLLILFAPLLESRLGHFPFLLLYLAGGVAAWAVAGAFCQGAGRSTAFVGSFGALAAVFGAFLVLYPFGDIRFIYMIGIFPIRFYSGKTPIPGLIVIGIWLLMQIPDFYSGLVLGGGLSPLTFIKMGGFLFGAFAAAMAYGKEGLRRETRYYA